MSATLVLLKNRRPGQTAFLAEYQRAGGYQALRQAVGNMEPAAIRTLVLDSGLRGRGGAGFPPDANGRFSRPIPRARSTWYATATRWSQALTRIAF